MSNSDALERSTEALQTDTESAPDEGRPSLDLKPRMTGAEVKTLQRIYSKAPVVLEFGCGGSTRVAVESAVRKIISVESDKGWVDIIEKHPLIAGAKQQDRLFINYADIGPTGRWGKPVSKRTARFWPRYHNQIWSHPWLAQPDAVVLVDGRFRVACCLQAALRQTTPFTLMVHDYTPRGGYPILDQFLEKVEIVDSLAVFKSRDLSKDQFRLLASKLIDYALDWH